MTAPFMPQHTSQVVDGHIHCPLCEWSIEIFTEWVVALMQARDRVAELEAATR